jgi:hypothetical protein
MVEMCADCGVFFETPEFVATDLSNYKIRQQRVYKKGDHFKEVISQFQGKEGKHIPQETLERIKADLVEVETVAMTDVRKSLRNLRLNKYVENAFYIYHVAAGKEPPYIKKEVEDKMIKLFKQIERAFATVKPTGWLARRSFLKCYNVLCKLLEMLYQDELLPQIPLLKTKLRLKQHDALWRKICDELDWGFRPTKNQYPYG